MGALVKLDLDGKSVTFTTDRNGARIQIDAFGGMLGVQLTLEQAEELGAAMFRAARDARRKGI